MQYDISKLLDLIRVERVSCTEARHSTGWSTQIPATPLVAQFHIIISGQAMIAPLQDGAPKQLFAGDIAIIPRGVSHHLSAQVPNAPTAPQPDEPLRVLSGQFEFSKDVPLDLTSRLPNLLTSQRSAPSSAGELPPIVQLLLAEVQKPTGPQSFVLNRLIELLCQDMFQGRISTASADQDSVHTISNPRLTEVIEAISAGPNAPWTVESLARIYGQSRSAFAAHFKLAMGQSPITYVRLCRINRACKMLEETGLSVDEVAFQSGYEDANAFNRAFRRETGASPGAYRRHQRA